MQSSPALRMPSAPLPATKVFGAAAQGAAAATVAAAVSAIAEPLVNRLLVERKTIAEARRKSPMSMGSHSRRWWGTSGWKCRRCTRHLATGSPRHQRSPSHPDTPLALPCRRGRLGTARCCVASTCALGRAAAGSRPGLGLRVCREHSVLRQAALSAPAGGAARASPRPSSGAPARPAGAGRRGRSGPWTPGLGPPCRPGCALGWFRSRAFGVARSPPHASVLRATGDACPIRFCCEGRPSWKRARLIRADSARLGMVRRGTFTDVPVCRPRFPLLVQFAAMLMCMHAELVRCSVPCMCCPAIDCGVGCSCFAVCLACCQLLRSGVRSWSLVDLARSWDAISQGATAGRLMRHDGVGSLRHAPIGRGQHRSMPA